jgi:hypothetical protein
MRGLKRGNIQGTETMRFIKRSEMPQGREATYAKYVCEYKPHKQEQERTRITVGGDRIDYPGEVATKSADITTIKCLLNSVVSTKNGRFATADVKNFYLNTPMARPEYMKIKVEFIPQEVQDEYDITDKIVDGYVYVEINKGMYGLPQAGILANRLLAKRLDAYGFRPTQHTPGLWRHDSRPIQFALVVDDFGIQYVNKSDVDYLLDALRKHYEDVTVEWAGKKFCGVNLTWNYPERHVDISMPGYIQKILHRFQHTAVRREDQPYRNNAPQYGQKVQFTEPEDNSPPLDKQGIEKIMQIVGGLLFYARMVDPTIMMALSDLASAQSKATEETRKATEKLLDYCATHPDATIRFTASDMSLKIHSDASYLTAPKARSRVGGHFYLGNNPRPETPDILNGAVLTIAGILKNVVSSAAEAEIGGLYVNTREGEVLRTTLTELGWKQSGPTPVTTDNSTACGIANDTIKQRRSKAIDMRYYWVRDRVAQKHFTVTWAPAAFNLADYHTKHHAAKHHREVRSIYVREKLTPKFVPNPNQTNLRGCIDSYRGTTYVDPGMTRCNQICPLPFRVTSIYAKAKLLGPKIPMADQSGPGYVLANNISASETSQLGPADERANHKLAGEKGPGIAVFKCNHARS